MSSPGTIAGQGREPEAPVAPALQPGAPDGLADEKILIVIPCLNEEKTIESVVRFAAADARALSSTIVVVDGRSHDRTQAVVRGLMPEYANLRLVENEKRIQSAAINLAVEQFGEGHTGLLRLDAHAEYPAGFIPGAVRIARAQNCDSVVVPMVTQGQGCFQKAAAAAQNSLVGNGGSPHRRPPSVSGWVDHGHHAFMRLDPFRRVGGYDTSFTHNEDAELDSRLTRNGSRIWLASELPMIYFPRATPASLWRQYFSYGQGRARTLLKHGAKPKLRQIAPALVCPALILALIPAPLAAVPAICWLAMNAGFSVFMAVLKRDACLLLSGLALAIMHLGWSVGFWRSLLMHGWGARRSLNDQPQKQDR